ASPFFRKRKKTASCYRNSLLSAVQLFSKVAGTNQLGQSLNSFLLIGTIGDQGDGGTLDNAQGQNAQQALGVNTPLVLLNPDTALELIGLADEIGGRSRVQTDLVIDGYFLSIHRPLFSSSIAISASCYPQFGNILIC